MYMHIACTALMCNQNKRMPPRLNVFKTCIEGLHCHTLAAASIFIPFNMGVAMLNRGMVINQCGLSLKRFVKSWSLCRLHHPED